MAETFPKSFGKYQLLRKLAQGGMAEIFLAQDARGNICAIKRILPHLAHEESFIRMFIDEARIVSHLDHPNIAAVYDQGKEQGYYYIGMEFVQGHSLLALSEKARQTKMELPRGLLAFVVADFLAGLGCAHSARDNKGRHLGIVHRDVTPQNVLISYAGEVKLIDFGVAKARARLTQTEAGFTKGKLAYMSPEQARGEELDGRSDLFSVGIILHEITTNTRLFNKEGPGGILGAIVNDPIPPPSSKVRGYPQELERIVMRALEKDISRRFQTAEDIRDELLRFARRERPPPSKQRLSQLVHDLFGESESQAVIDRARELAAPTPDRVEAHVPSLVTGAEREPSLPHAPAPEPSPSEPSARRSDETRMMQAGMVDIRERSRSRVETTNPRQALSEAIAEEPPVPVPVTPIRVRMARFVRDLAADVRLSWREQFSRWVLGLGLGVAGLLILVLVFSGLAGLLSDWMSAAADAAREAKSMAGLSEETLFDSGVSPPKLRITSEPPGASISVDGVGMGAVTPHVIEGLPFGKTLRIELNLAGYRSLEEKLELVPQKGTQEEHFTLERMIGSIRVRTKPSGARVFIDGRDTFKKTPAEISGLPSGRVVRVEARLPGRLSKSSVIVVPDGRDRLVELSLPVDRSRIPPGRIDVSSRPRGCPVYVDEEYVGVTPVSGHSARPGLHLVKIACPHHAPEIRNVMVVSKSVKKVSVQARPDTFGYLTLRPIPSQGTTVEINGRSVKTPVRFLKVVPGRHVVTLRNAELHAEKTVSINVGPDARVTREIRLSF